MWDGPEGRRPPFLSLEHRFPVSVVLGKGNAVSYGAQVGLSVPLDEPPGEKLERAPPAT